MLRNLLSLLGKILFWALLWLPAAAAAAAEGLLVWAWLRGMLYLEQFGVDGNLRVEEETCAVGFLALLLFPVFLLLLALAVYGTTKRNKQRRRANEDEVSDGT